MEDILQRTVPILWGSEELLLSNVDRHQIKTRLASHCYIEAIQIFLETNGKRRNVLERWKVNTRVVLSVRKPPVSTSLPPFPSRYYAQSTKHQSDESFGIAVPAWSLGGPPFSSSLSTRLRTVSRSAIGSTSISPMSIAGKKNNIDKNKTSRRTWLRCWLRGRRIRLGLSLLLLLPCRVRRSNYRQNLLTSTVGTRHRKRTGKKLCADNGRISVEKVFGILVFFVLSHFQVKLSANPKVENIENSWKSSSSIARGQ